MAMHRMSAEQFWQKVDSSAGPNSCWMWKGRVTRGYGCVSIGNRQTRANRAAWLFHVGQIPAGKVVCHSCDQPLCCNPAHLWLGTVAENNADCRSKARHAHGERVWSARLTPEGVRLLRAMYSEGTPRRVIAERFNVALPTVYAVASRRIWGHVA